MTGASFLRYLSSCVFRWGSILKMPFERQSESNRIRRMLFNRAARDFQTACMFCRGDAAIAALETDLNSSQLTIRSVIAEEAAKTAVEKRVGIDFFYSLLEHKPPKSFVTFIYVFCASTRSKLASSSRAVAIAAFHAQNIEKTTPIPIPVRIE